MKKMFILYSLSVIMMTVQRLQNNNNDNLSSLLLENIDALTSGETTSCNNVNGYKSRDTNGNIFNKKKEFYDCCYILREGYKPSGNCNG